MVGTFPGYTTVCRLGGGAFGVVYKCIRGDGQILAIKELHPRLLLTADDAGREKIRRQWQQEIAHLSELHHPNIVEYHGAEFGDDDIGFIKMEFLGPSLDSELKNMHRSARVVPESILRSWTQQILSGLEYIHGRGIVHADLKPQNILLDSKGVVRLVDFGVSKVVDRGIRHLSCDVVGTPAFMAPEVVTKRICTASDVWSAACVVLAAAFWGGSPWTRNAEAMAIDELLPFLFYVGARESAVPVIPGDLLTPDACAFLARCLQRDFRARPSPTELLQVCGSATQPETTAFSKENFINSYFL